MLPWNILGFKKDVSRYNFALEEVKTIVFIELIGLDKSKFRIETIKVLEKLVFFLNGLKSYFYSH